MTDRCYYVYVYIDPRNHEEFYYGKGKGARRFSHLSDTSDSDKVARIRAIERDGQIPIVRTVAAGLTEAEAHLVETTLLWKLGRGLTNKAAGRFVSLFRPHNTLHKELPRFDYENGIYYFNVGQSEVRNWEDCRRLGFISAGQGTQWRDQILEFAKGDVVVAYLKGKGYVGVGKVRARAVPYLDFRINGKLLQDFNLVAPKMWSHSEDLDRSEYVVSISWAASCPPSEAKWNARSGLFTTPLVRASLERQTATVAFVEARFGVSLKKLAT